MLTVSAVHLMFTIRSTRSWYSACPGRSKTLMSIHPFAILVVYGTRKFIERTCSNSLKMIAIHTNTGIYRRRRSTREKCA